MNKSDGDRILPNGESLSNERGRIWRSMTERARLGLLKSMRDWQRNHGLTQEQAENVAYGGQTITAAKNEKLPLKKFRASPVGEVSGRIPWNKDGKERLEDVRSEFDLIWKALNVRIPKEQQKTLFGPHLYDLLKAVRLNAPLRQLFYGHVLSILAAEHRKKMELGQEPSTDENRVTLMEILDDARVSRKSESSGD